MGWMGAAMGWMGALGIQRLLCRSERRVTSFEKRTRLFVQVERQKGPNPTHKYRPVPGTVSRLPPVSFYRVPETRN